MRRVSLAARRAQQFFRRPPRPRWMRPAAHAGAIGLAIGIGWGAVWWGTSSGAFDRAWTGVADRVHEASAALGLVVAEVEIEGLSRTDPAPIDAVLDNLRGTPLLALDTGRVREALERDPWVERAVVRRALPDIVNIHLFERQPLALWQKAGSFQLVDRGGEIIEIQLKNDRDVARWRHLRVIVGKGAPQSAAELFAVLSRDPELFARVEAATRVGERRWSLRFDVETDVLLPELGLARAWRTLGRLQRRDQLLERAIGAIDLRFLPDRVRLRLLPEALPDRAA